MDIIKTAAKYVLDIFTDNEELKKFPKEFINESVKWVKSWFLVPEDPKTNAKLEDPIKSIEVKKDIINDKLDDLKSNPQFIKELSERLTVYEQHRVSIKNALINSNLDIGGNAHIGDVGISMPDNTGERNIVKGSTIKAGGNFRLGDDIISGNQQVNINFISSGLFIPDAPVLKQIDFALYAKSLMEENQIEELIDFLKSVTPNTGKDIYNSIILTSARFNANERDNQRNTISYDNYKVEAAQIRRAFQYIIDKIAKDNKLNNGLSSNKKETITLLAPAENDLERVLGSQDYLVKIAWLQKGLKASKSVCRVVLPDGKNGTGFILEGGYLLTNFHVLYDNERIETAKIEFNYEEDILGALQKPTTYLLDSSDCKLSNLENLDYAYVKIKDNPMHSIKEWGFLEIDTFPIPQEGEPVNIIQHPEGGVKQIALTYNYVIGTLEHRLFYRTDTKKGSSGSPVFNKDWKVVALHHAGSTEKEGGLEIDVNGTKMAANEGILMKYIQADLTKPNK